MQNLLHDIRAFYCSALIPFTWDQSVFVHIGYSCNEPAAMVVRDYHISMENKRRYVVTYHMNVHGYICRLLQDKCLAGLLCTYIL